MWLKCLIFVAFLSHTEAIPSVVRNISDCSITGDGILYYRGQHAMTKFEKRCVPWLNLQNLHPEIINETNFFHDRSIKAANNYCRNPTMSKDGPWCFVQENGTYVMELCDVCQSLAIRTETTSDVSVMEQLPELFGDKKDWQNLQNLIQLYATYFRLKVSQVIEQLKTLGLNLLSEILPQ